MSIIRLYPSKLTVIMTSIVPWSCAVLCTDKNFASWFLGSRLSNLFYSENHNFLLLCLRTFFSNCKKLKEFDTEHLYTYYLDSINILLYLVYQVYIHLSIHQFILIFYVSQVVDMSTFFSMRIID